MKKKLGGFGIKKKSYRLMMKKMATVLGISMTAMLTLSGCSYMGIDYIAKGIAVIIRYVNYDDYNNSGNQGNQNNGHGNGGNQNGSGQQYPGGSQNNGNGGVTFADEIIQYDEGVVATGPIVVHPETFFMVEHYNDITYDQAIAEYDISNNYKILGGYGYPSINSKCAETANYDYFADKSIEYAYYEQDIPNYVSGQYNSVLPVYVSCFNGFSEEMAASISEFNGNPYIYSNDDENPFYKPEADKRQRIHDGLVELYGEELAEEYFENYLRVLEMDFIEFVYLAADYSTQTMTGSTVYGGTYFLELDDSGEEGVMYVADVMIDPYTYEIGVQNPDNWLSYKIKLADDGMTYRLYYESGFSMDYEKASDNYLVGYVAEDSKAFHDIVGIEICAENYFYPNCGAAYLTSYGDLNQAKTPKITMRDGSIAVNPQFEFLDGNMLTISFDSVLNYQTGEETEYSVSYTVCYGLIGYLHDSNCGFVLKDDSGIYYFGYDRYDAFGSEMDGPDADGEGEPGNGNTDDDDNPFGDSENTVTANCQPVEFIV